MKKKKAAKLAKRGMTALDTLVPKGARMVVASDARRAAPVVIFSAQGSYGFGLTNTGSTRVFSLGNYNLLHRRELEASPTIAVIAAVVSRMFRSLRLTVRRPGGMDLASHALLDLFNDAPNEFYGASEFWAQVARELVLGGECIIRVHRRGRVPYRLAVWPYDETNIDPPSRITAEPDCLCTYRYRDAVVDFVPGKPPPVCHVRMSVDHDRPLRGLDPWRGLHAEVLSSTFAALYRSEYFRQGGSPRLVAIMEGGEIVGNLGSTETDKAQELMDAVFKSVKAGLTTWQGGQAHRMPAGVSLVDMGPKSPTDPMMIMASRAVDEKLLASAGLPAISINNMEKSTYANSRQQQAVLVRDAIQPRLDAYLSAIRRDLLKPMGGRNAALELHVDTTKLVEDEAAVYNKLILDQLAGGMITANEAREKLGYEPDPAFAETDATMADRDDEGDEDAADEDTEAEKDAKDKTDGGD